MRPHRRDSLSAADEGPEETHVRERNPALAGEVRNRGRRAMTDPVRDRVLVEALPDIAMSGFTETVLQDAAERAGLSKREILDAFPNGAASLVEAFSQWADSRMADRVKSELPERVRDRIAAAVR